MKVAVYCRVSKADGSQDVQRQVDDLTKFCDERQWQIVETVIEEASGSKAKREGTQKLVKLAKGNFIQKVVIQEVNSSNFFKQRIVLISTSQ